MVKQNRILAMVLLTSIGITQIYALNPSRTVLPVATAIAVAGSLAAYNAMNESGSEIINAPVAIDNVSKVIEEHVSHEDVQEMMVSTKLLANHAAQRAIEVVSKNGKLIAKCVAGALLVWLVYDWIMSKFSNKQMCITIDTDQSSLSAIRENQTSNAYLELSDYVDAIIFSNDNVIDPEPEDGYYHDDE